MYINFEGFDGGNENSLSFLTKEVNAIITMKSQ